MSFKATTTAIQNDFAVKWTRSEVILYENMPISTNPAELNPAWGRLSIREAAARQVSYGSAANKPVWRYTGRIILQLFQRAGTGTATIEDMGDFLRPLYRRFAINDTSAGLIRNAPAEAPRFLLVGERNGWMQANFEIPYIRDLHELG